VQKVTILRSNRKSIAIEIQSGSSILIRAPLRTSQSRIDALLLEKKNWIEEKLALVKHRQSQVPIHAYQPGELFQLLGVGYPLILVDRARPDLIFNEAFELSERSQSRAQQIFTRWYRKEASRLFQERILIWSTVTGLHPNSFGLSSARTRWGSCSSRGKINLTWRLVMAPVPIIDYVVVHELVHLKVKNHSKSFWETVQSYLPDYKKLRKWLNENGLKLDI
jgi:predicted metal-dependent hydrolase